MACGSSRWMKWPLLGTLISEARDERPASCCWKPSQSPCSVGETPPAPGVFFEILMRPQYDHRQVTERGDGMVLPVLLDEVDPPGSGRRVPPTRGPEGTDRGQLLRLAGRRRREERSEDVELILVHGIGQHQPRHFGPIVLGEQPRQQAPIGVAHQDIGPGLTGQAQQGVEFGDHVHRRPRAGRRVSRRRGRPGCSGTRGRRPRSRAARAPIRRSPRQGPFPGSRSARPARWWVHRQPPTRQLDDAVAGPSGGGWLDVLGLGHRVRLSNRAWGMQPDGSHL